MTDAGERVVLRADREVQRPVAEPARERGRAVRRYPMSTASPASASSAGRPCARPLLLELQLGMRVDAMTQRRRAPLRSLDDLHARAALASISSVASHRARRRRNGRRRSASDPGRRRSSSTSTDRSRRSSTTRSRGAAARRRSTCSRGLVGVLGCVGIVSGRPVDFLARRGAGAGPGVRRAVRDGARARRRASRSIRGCCRSSGASPKRRTATADSVAARRGSSSARPASASRCTGGSAPERRDEVRGRGRARRAARARLRCGRRMAIELRPPVAVDKGTAVDALIDGLRRRRVRRRRLGRPPRVRRAARAPSTTSGCVRAVRIGVRLARSAARARGRGRHRRRRTRRAGALVGGRAGAGTRLTDQRACSNRSLSHVVG